MPSFAVSTAQLAALKRSSREQLPQVRHTHILEALARGFYFNSWLALNTQIKAATTSVITEFSLTAMQTRLEELGYRRASTQHLSFEHLEALPRGTLSIVTRTPAVERPSITLDTLTDRGFITPEHRLVLRTLISKGSVIILTGPTATGKTTLATALLTEMARRAPQLHFGFFQQVRELPLQEDNVTHYELMLEDSRWLHQKRSPCDIAVVDDLRDAKQLRRALQSWKRFGQGLITMHTRPSLAITRLHTVAGLDRPAGSAPLASQKTLRGLVHAVVEHDRRPNTRSFVRKIALRGEF